MEETPNNRSNVSREEPESGNFRERFSRFEEEMQNIAATERGHKSPNGAKHFGEIPNFDLITEEDKKAMVEIWDKIKDGSISRGELGDFTARVTSEIGKIGEGAGMTSEEISRLTLYGVASLFGNRATPVIVRREMRERKSI